MIKSWKYNKARHWFHYTLLLKFSAACKTRINIGALALDDSQTEY